MAPPCVITFMDSLEEVILSNSLLKPLVWWHYIDDIFILWKHGEQELKKFLETLNCYHPTINFLDVADVKKDNQYLHSNPCYVCHCKKSIPFRQALHFNRICSVLF